MRKQTIEKTEGCTWVKPTKTFQSPIRGENWQIMFDKGQDDDSGQQIIDTTQNREPNRRYQVNQRVSEFNGNTWNAQRVWIFRDRRYSDSIIAVWLACLILFKQQCQRDSNIFCNGISFYQKWMGVPLKHKAAFELGAFEKCITTKCSDNPAD